MIVAGQGARCLRGLAISFLALLAAGCASLPRVGPESDAEAGMVWPVIGAIASPYRPESRPGHQGVDLAAPPGSPVVAATSGAVSFVGRIAGYGNVVAMSHADQITTVYAHLQEPNVKVGDPLRRNDIVGHVGEEGYLHYEIRRTKDPADPAEFYSMAPNPIASAMATDVTREPGAEVPLAHGAEPEAVVPEPPPPAPEREAAPVAEPAPPRAEPTKAPVASAPRGKLEKKDRRVARGAAEPPPPAPEPQAVTSEPVPPAEPSARPGMLGSPRDEVASAPEAPPASVPPPAAVDAAERGGGNLVAGLVVSNLLYVPAKLAYVAAGGVIGGFAFVLTGGSVTDVWSAAFGGDWYIRAEHFSGEAPLRFGGS